MSPGFQPQEPLQFILFFTGIWFFVSFNISYMGWRAFAKRYPAPIRPAGTVYTSPATRFGNFFARYGNVIQIIFAETGVYFYVVFLFRPFHPPFLLPWGSVKNIEKKTLLFWSRYQMNVEDLAGKIRVALPVRIEHDPLWCRKVAAGLDGCQS